MTSRPEATKYGFGLHQPRLPASELLACDDGHTSCDWYRATSDAVRRLPPTSDNSARPRGWPRISSQAVRIAVELVEAMHSGWELVAVSRQPTYSDLTERSNPSRFAPGRARLLRENRRGHATTSNGPVSVSPGLSRTPHGKDFRIVRRFDYHFKSYDNGLGVPQDRVRAYMWLNLAATQGREGAATLRDLVARLMTYGPRADRGSAEALTRVEAGRAVAFSLETVTMIDTRFAPPENVTIASGRVLNSGEET